MFSTPAAAMAHTDIDDVASSDMTDEQMLFETLSPAARHAISRLTVSTSMKRGQLLVDPSKPARSVLVIRSGFVREFTMLSDGRQLTTRIVGPGGVVGEHSAVEDPTAEI